MDHLVRDHDHITGEFRGAAHNGCNLNHRETKKINVIFHNLKGYDSHLSIKVIANTDEKYMQMKIGRFVFIGSMQHLNSLLEKFVEGLDSKVPYLQTEYPNDYKLLARKGVYPYEWIDSFKKFDKKELPPIEAFASSLNNGAGISKKDHIHAKLVYKKLDCKNMGDYHDLYLKTDVLLLGDVFEKKYGNGKLQARSVSLHYCTISCLGCIA